MLFLPIVSVILLEVVYIAGEENEYSPNFQITSLKKEHVFLYV